MSAIRRFNSVGVERATRIGILGTARNVPFSILKPTRDNPDLASRMQVWGIASLDFAEAEKFAREHGIENVFKTFDDLLHDPQIDAVYNVLPVEHRCAWTIKALQAGKHVLSETPVGSNAMEAVAMQRAAEDNNKVLMEGTHPACHPVTKRVHEMILEGKIGRLEHIELDLPIGHSLQGKGLCSKTGALMSLGCHGVAIIRALIGEEPLVLNATAQRQKENPEVDEKMKCNLRFPGGAGAHVVCSIAPATRDMPTTYTISGQIGTIRVSEWFTGSTKGANEIELDQFEETGEVVMYRLDNAPERNTFYFQLMAFADEIKEQARRGVVGLPWSYTKGKGPSDFVRNMALIDGIYRAANLKVKPTVTPPPQPYDKVVVLAKL